MRFPGSWRAGATAWGPSSTELSSPCVGTPRSWSPTAWSRESGPSYGRPGADWAACPSSHRDRSFSEVVSCSNTLYGVWVRCFAGHPVQLCSFVMAAEIFKLDSATGLMSPPGNSSYPCSTSLIWRTAPVSALGWWRPGTPSASLAAARGNLRWCSTA